jgi:hypothetical protein
MDKISSVKQTDSVTSHLFVVWFLVLGLSKCIEDSPTKTRLMISPNEEVPVIALHFNDNPYHHP